MRALAAHHDVPQIPSQKRGPGRFIRRSARGAAVLGLAAGLPDAPIAPKRIVAPFDPSLGLLSPWLPEGVPLTPRTARSVLTGDPDTPSMPIDDLAFTYRAQQAGLPLATADRIAELARGDRFHDLPIKIRKPHWPKTLPHALGFDRLRMTEERYGRSRSALPRFRSDRGALVRFAHAPEGRLELWVTGAGLPPLNWPLEQGSEVARFMLFHVLRAVHQAEGTIGPKGSMWSPSLPLLEKLERQATGLELADKVEEDGTFGGSPRLSHFHRSPLLQDGDAFLEAYSYQSHPMNLRRVELSFGFSPLRSPTSGYSSPLGSIRDAIEMPRHRGELVSRELTGDGSPPRIEVVTPRRALTFAEELRLVNLRADLDAQRTEGTTRLIEALKSMALASDVRR